MSTFDDRCGSGDDTQINVADETFAGDALKPTHEQENVGTENGQLDLDVVEDVADEASAGDALEPILEQDNGGTTTPDSKDDQLELDVVMEIEDIRDNVELEVEELTYL